ncbi:MAG: fused MFS/spermidine synthase [Bacteroidia bacterium]
MINIFKSVWSFIYPLTVEKTSSHFNSVLEVRIENGKYVLNAANANYSFGSLHRIFLNAFKQTTIGERPIKNVLLLGFGAGSVPVLLFDEFKIDCKITAIEIDEKVIALGKKYFNIQRFEKLELICADAYEYVLKCNMKFDLIITDIFIDDKVPSQVEQVEFIAALKKLMNPGSMILFNKIINVENGMASLSKLQKQFKSVFDEYDVLNISGNVIIKVVS